MEVKPKGVCAKKIEFELDGSKIKSVHFEGGCPGNLLGICNLVIGMEAEDVISRFEGVKCGMKKTSCPDQFAKALKEAIDSSVKKGA